MKVTYQIAMAAGRDAGNKNARKHGRSVWNADDYSVAAEIAHKLMYGYGKPVL